MILLPWKNVNLYEVIYTRVSAGKMIYIYDLPSISITNKLEKLELHINHEQLRRP